MSNLPFSSNKYAQKFMKCVFSTQYNQLFHVAKHVNSCFSSFESILYDFS